MHQQHDTLDFNILCLEQIIVGDCMAALDKYVKEGKKFDYIFGDLTDIPISETPTGEIWNFIRTILQQSFKILKPSGTYLTHVSRNFEFERLEFSIIVIFTYFRVMALTVLSPCACTKNN